jgi:hypothetical protein
VKLTNEEIQGSKMRLLNVIFSEELCSDVVTMNDSIATMNDSIQRVEPNSMPERLAVINGYGAQSRNPTTTQQIMVSMVRLLLLKTYMSNLL